MGWFEAIMLVASLAIQVAAQTGGGKDQPQLPGYIPPDFEPLIEQGAYTKYQDKTRNTLLNEFYGGKIVGGREQFGGEKPAQKYRAEQGKTIAESTANFAPALRQYYAERGMQVPDNLAAGFSPNEAFGGQVAGAGAELSKDYSQKTREINAKAHDISALTLGTLFGEVSDAGMQSAQLTGMVGQASQMENQRRDADYQRAMAKWQYDQSQPNTWSTIGSLLPYLSMAYKGVSGTPSTSYYGQAQTMNPGTNYNTSTNGPSNMFNYT